MEQVGEEDQDFLLVRVPVLDAPEQNRSFAMLAQRRHRDDLVAEDVALFRNRTHLNSRVNRVGLHPRNEEDPIPRQLSEPHVIVIATVYGQDRTRFQVQVTRYVQLAMLSLRHHGERGQVAVVVQQQMELDRALLLRVFGPVKHGRRQLDDAAIQAHQLVLETELATAVRSRLRLTFLQ